MELITSLAKKASKICAVSNELGVIISLAILIELAILGEVQEQEWTKLREGNRDQCHLRVAEVLDALALRHASQTS